MGKALWGLSEWSGYRGDYEQAGGVGDPGARDLRADRGPVLGQLAEVRPRRRTRACIATSGRGGRPRPDAAGVLARDRDVSGLALVLAGVARGRCC